MQEWPKWMHRLVGGKPESKVFAKEDDVPQGEGWTPDRSEEHLKASEGIADDGTGVSASQRVAAMDIKDAEDRKRTADAFDHPTTASPATPAPPPIDHADGHRGIEYTDASGAKLIVADVDTMERDRVISTLQSMGVEYDGRWGLQRLQDTLRDKLSTGNVAQSANIVTTDVRA